MSQLKVDALTDEVGTGAPDFPNGATSGGSDVYAKGNILGTVSESSGTPTGAIIQRGSNANGEFVRFADGTQICFHAITIDHTDSLSSNSRLAATWTYPATFVGTIVTQMSVPVHVNANFSGCARLDITVFGPSGGNVPTAQAFSIFFNSGTVSTTAASVLNVQVSAHGRWF